MKLSTIIQALQKIASEEVTDCETDVIVLHTNTSLSVTGRSPEGILWIGGETKYYHAMSYLSDERLEDGMNDPYYIREMQEGETEGGHTLDEWRQLNWRF